MQRIWSRSLLVLSLVSIAVPASAQVIEGNTAGSNGASTASEGASGTATPSATAAPATTSTKGPRVQTLAVGFAWNGLMFHTSNGDNYRFQGPGFGLDYFVGRRWGFALHIGMGFPIHGAEVGAYAFNGSLGGNVYDGSRMSLNTLYMAARRMPINDRLTFVYGFGVSVNTLRLVSTQYSPIELIAGGLGAVARIEYALTSLLFLSGQLMAAIDPIDFIRHTNRAVMTNPISGSVNIGLKF